MTATPGKVIVQSAEDIRNLKRCGMAVGLGEITAPGGLKNLKEASRRSGIQKPVLVVEVQWTDGDPRYSEVVNCSDEMFETLKDSSENGTPVESTQTAQSWDIPKITYSGRVKKATVSAVSGTMYQSNDMLGSRAPPTLIPLTGI